MITSFWRDSSSEWLFNHQPPMAPANVSNAFCRPALTRRLLRIGAGLMRCASAFIAFPPVRRPRHSGRGPVPESVEPGADRPEPGRIDRVDAARALGLVAHQPRLLQHLQMLRHGRPADRQPRGELAHRHRPLGEPLDDRLAHRLGKRGKQVSHSLPLV